MNVQFFGAAQTVTGSCYILEACGTRFAVDCGLHQGNSDMDARNYDTTAYRAGDIDFILLTHAHIDHSGLLPRIVSNGFSGSIYCTAPTADLVALMLEDSAHIQETEAEWRRKKLSRRTGQSSATKEKTIQPLYTIEDARKVPELCRTVQYEKTFSPHSGIEVVYHDAGHILGSATLELIITEDGKTTRIAFSGDLGRPGTLLMNDPSFPTGPIDYLFMESTYGDRNHKNEAATFDEMAEAIEYSYKNHDKVIIPAFAVGRTQELLYCLYLLQRQGKLPHDMPIFVDSPLAIRATELFKKYKDMLSAPEVAKNATSVDTLLPNLHFTLSAAESQALNTMKGPAIIISASGMCNAGRIRHHLRHNLWRPTASIVFVGYQGIGTPGRKIVDGAQTLRLFNEDVAVKAKVFTIGGFSAHAGQTQMIDWMTKATVPSTQVVLVHGEEEAQKNFAKLIHETLQLAVSIPGYLEEMQLTPGADVKVQTLVQPKPSPHLNWNMLLQDTENKMAQLREQLANMDNRPWEEQVEIRDRLLELNKELLSMLMHM